MKQSAGYIQVSSELGSGTKFQIYFPQISEPVRQRKPPAAIRESLRGSETILLVEDEIKVRQIVRLFLQREGYTVVEAGNGAEALQVAKESKQPIHLLLTDVIMPRMSGPELAQQLAKDHKELKVLFLSGYSDHPLVEKSISKPNNSFLAKPFNRETLLRKVRELLDVGKAVTREWIKKSIDQSKKRPSGGRSYA